MRYLLVIGVSMIAFANPAATAETPTIAVFTKNTTNPAYEAFRIGADQVGRALGARIVTGLLTGACAGIAGGGSLWLGALLGAVGGIAGAFGGYHARVGLVRGLQVPDFAIAIPEDLIAIGFGLLIVSRF